MEYVNLGQSSISVSRLGFGCDQLGLYDWGETSSNKIQSAIAMAMDRGINFFDTADCYGKGCSEELLTSALGSKRRDAVIATKFGVRFDAKGATYYDSSIKWLDQALDDSLRRLGTDYIDLYQLHYWDGKTDLQELFAHLEDKVIDGKIRTYGVTNMTITRPSNESTHPNLVSFSREMSLAMRAHEKEISDTVEGLGLTFLSWGSLGQGILTGKYSAHNLPTGDDRRTRHVYKNFHGQKLAKNLKLIAVMKDVARVYPEKTLSQIAIRALLDRIGGAVVLAGVKSVDQLHENVGALDWHLDQQNLDQLFRHEFLD